MIATMSLGGKLESAAHRRLGRRGSLAQQIRDQNSSTEALLGLDFSRSVPLIAAVSTCLRRRTTRSQDGEESFTQGGRLMPRIGPRHNS